MTDLRAAHARLVEFARTRPDAVEEFPWGERVFKVKKKVFVFLGHASEVGERLGLSVKLPTSAEAALESGFGAPTGYGLGKSGWVSLGWEHGDTVPVEQVEAWIQESYDAIRKGPARSGRAARGAARPARPA